MIKKTLALIGKHSSRLAAAIVKRVRGANPAKEVKREKPAPRMFRFRPANAPNRAERNGATHVARHCGTTPPKITGEPIPPVFGPAMLPAEHDKPVSRQTMRRALCARAFYRVSEVAPLMSRRDRRRHARLAAKIQYRAIKAARVTEANAKAAAA